MDKDTLYVFNPETGACTKTTWDEMFNKIARSGKVSIRPMRKYLAPSKK